MRIPSSLTGWTRLSMWLIGAMLTAAAMITVAIGSLAAPRSMPDEHHHYAVVKHIADHFGQFPLDYAAIKTDRESVPNHLVHPPLYHYLMALFYKGFGLEKHFTVIGKDVDRHGSIPTSEAIIPLLRGMSQFLLFLGFLGTFFLLKDCLQRDLLTPWTAIACGLTLSFMAGFLYIGSALNNDVLGLVIWPWLALFLLNYLVEGRSNAFWKAWVLIMALILTKASFWMMALGAGLLLLSKWVANLRMAKGSLARSFHGWGRITWLWAAGAVLLALLATVHLGTQWRDYGRLQPDYHQVFEVSAEESKFLKASSVAEVIPRPAWEVGGICALRIVEGLRGTISHLEPIGDTHPLAPFAWLLLGSGLVLVSSLPWWHLGKQRWLKLFLATCLALPVLNFVILFMVNVEFYQRTQDVAAEARYFAGYVQFAILAFFMLGTKIMKTQGWRRVQSWMSGIGLLIMVMILVQPLSFFQQTHEVFYRANMGELIPQHLREMGFQRLSMHPTTPHVTSYRHLKFYARLGDYYPLYNPDDRLSFELPFGPDAWHVRLWVEGPQGGKGDHILEIARLNQQVHKDPSVLFSSPSQKLRIPKKLCVLSFDLPAQRPGEESMWIMAPQLAPLESYWLLHGKTSWLKPRPQPLKVLGIFVKPKQSQNRHQDLEPGVALVLDDASQAGVQP